MTDGVNPENTAEIEALEREIDRIKKSLAERNLQVIRLLEMGILQSILMNDPAKAACLTMELMKCRRYGKPPLSHTKLLKLAAAYWEAEQLKYPGAPFAGDVLQILA
jgi:hypothetical protein